MVLLILLVRPQVQNILKFVFVMRYLLSFFRSQNVLCRSNFLSKTKNLIAFNCLVLLQVLKSHNYFMPVPDILCHTKRWFPSSKFSICDGRKVFQEAINSIKFLDWLKIFGPAQNILGPVKGHGITKTLGVVQVRTPHPLQNDYVVYGWYLNYWLSTNTRICEGCRITNKKLHKYIKGTINMTNISRILSHKRLWFLQLEIVWYLVMDLFRYGRKTGFPQFPLKEDPITLIIIFSNFSCMFLNRNNFFQFEF